MPETFASKNLLSEDQPEMCASTSANTSSVWNQPTPTVEGWNRRSTLQIAATRIHPVHVRQPLADRDLVRVILMQLMSPHHHYPLQIGKKASFPHCHLTRVTRIFVIHLLGQFDSSDKCSPVNLATSVRLASLYHRPEIFVSAGEYDLLGFLQLHTKPKQSTTRTGD
jgi:hypothetical protein